MSVSRTREASKEILIGVLSWHQPNKIMPFIKGALPTKAKADICSVCVSRIKNEQWCCLELPQLSVSIVIGVLGY